MSNSFPARFCSPTSSQVDILEARRSDSRTEGSSWSPYPRTNSPPGRTWSSAFRETAPDPCGNATWADCRRIRRCADAACFANRWWRCTADRCPRDSSRQVCASNGRRLVRCSGSSYRANPIARDALCWTTPPRSTSMDYPGWWAALGSLDPWKRRARLSWGRCSWWWVPAIFENCKESRLEDEEDVPRGTRWRQHCAVYSSAMTDCRRRNDTAVARNREVWCKNPEFSRRKYLSRVARSWSFSRWSPSLWVGFQAFPWYNNRPRWSESHGCTVSRGNPRNWPAWNRTGNSTDCPTPWKNVDAAPYVPYVPRRSSSCCSRRCRGYTIAAIYQTLRWWSGKCDFARDPSVADSSGLPTLRMSPISIDCYAMTGSLSCTNR